LDIKFKHFQKLEQKRNEAVRTEVLSTSEDDLVPATLRTGHDTFRVKVRLKGDMTDHLRGDRWSFRIEVRDGRSVFGMRRFSLQAPYTRNFHQEPLLFDFLRFHGLLAPRYFFVNLYINGKRIGVTALEEHFSKELLESQQRRESVILKFDESYYWANRKIFGDKAAGYSNWRNTPIDVFRMNKIRESKELSRYLKSGVGLLRGVTKNSIAPARAFDAKLWGQLLAACEIWNVGHAMDFRQLRVYFNPLTFKLEPIAYDATWTGPKLDNPGVRCQGGESPIMDQLIDDPEIRRAFFSALKDMASSIHPGELLSELQTREREYLELLRVDFPWLQEVDWNDMRARAAALLALNDRNLALSRMPRPVLQMPHYKDADYPAVVYAYLESDASGTHLEISNVLATPVEVSDLRFEPDTLEEWAPLGRFVSRRPPYPLSPSRWPDPPQTVRVDIKPPPGAGSDWGVAGTVKVQGGDREYPFRARASFPASSTNPVPRATLTEALKRHAFLERDPTDASWLRVKPGTWNVDGWLVVPEGLGLRAVAGTTLRFETDAALVARGPLDFRGNRGAPVVLEAQPQPVQSGYWMGLVVLSSEKPSLWSHVVVRNTTGVARDDWMLTGGVTFRQAEVELSDSVFDGSLAEDALNLIRSQFTLRRVEFYDAASDALDADYCKGRIEGGEFRGIGGDGIDVGGTQIEIDGAHFERIRDKALSIGEGSSLRARGLKVESSGIGLASKDASHSFVEDSSFQNIEQIALVAYVKKEVFGGAELIAKNVRIDTRGRAALVQLGSRISLNGTEITAESIDVAELYKSGVATP
jgi:hypothetical protein